VFDPRDVDLIRRLIEKHAEYTGSPRARWILDNWYAMLPRFLMVFPHEYKRVIGAPRTADMPRITLTRPVTAQEVLRG
jgi:glutamate synthase domain-containing protein 3